MHRAVSPQQRSSTRSLPNAREVLSHRVLVWRLLPGPASDGCGTRLPATWVLHGDDSRTGEREELWRRGGGAGRACAVTQARHRRNAGRARTLCKLTVRKALTVPQHWNTAREWSRTSRSRVACGAVVVRAAPVLRHPGVAAWHVRRGSGPSALAVRAVAASRTEHGHSLFDVKSYRLQFAL